MYKFLTQGSTVMLQGVICHLKQHVNLESPSISAAKISESEKDTPTVGYLFKVAPIYLPTPCSQF